MAYLWHRAQCESHPTHTHTPDCMTLCMCTQASTSTEQMTNNETPGENATPLSLSDFQL